MAAENVKEYIFLSVRFLFGVFFIKEIMCCAAVELVGGHACINTIYNHCFGNIKCSIAEMVTYTNIIIC